jgi:hypothetical protein
MSEGDDGPFSGSGVEGASRCPGSEEQVCEALATHAQVDASQIGVAVDGATGDLILFGSVPTEEQRRLAEDCAVSISGVRVVYNRLAVGPHVDGEDRSIDTTNPVGPASEEPSDPAG